MKTTEEMKAMLDSTYPLARLTHSCMYKVMHDDSYTMDDLRRDTESLHTYVVDTIKIIQSDLNYLESNYSGSSDVVQKARKNIEPYKTDLMIATFITMPSHTFSPYSINWNIPHSTFNQVFNRRPNSKELINYQNISFYHVHKYRSVYGLGYWDHKGGR